jgi:hypothetical protein
MTDTLDSIHTAFAEYRRQHTRGAYPLVLRKRAMSALGPDERLQLAARLGLTAKQIGRWKTGPASSTPSLAQEFFEVPQVAHVDALPSNLRVDVELPGGVVMRMHGQIDLNALRMLVAAVLPGAVAR